MAILLEEAYAVQCDVCEKVYMNEHGSTLFVDKKTAKEKAQGDNWVIEEWKCYCPDCYEIDEDDI